MRVRAGKKKYVKIGGNVLTIFVTVVFALLYTDTIWLMWQPLIYCSFKWTANVSNFLAKIAHRTRHWTAYCYFDFSFNWWNDIDSYLLRTNHFHNCRVIFENNGKIREKCSLVWVHVCIPVTWNGPIYFNKRAIPNRSILLFFSWILFAHASRWHNRSKHFPDSWTFF